MTFDLLDNPWLPVVGPDGPKEMGLRQALHEAGEIKHLDHANPLVAASLYRLLTALARDLLPPLTSPDAWRDAFAAGRFDSDRVDAYLSEHGDRFDLFHPTRPFMQLGDLEAASGETKSIALLIPEVATGNNTPIFSSVTEDGLTPMRPAEAARRLIACIAFDTAAIKTGARGDPRVSGGKTTGNPTGPAGQLGVVIPLGRTLFETVLLSCLICSEHPGDRPAWRRDNVGPGWEIDLPKGPMDLLTWLSRRVRLFPEDTGDGTVVRHVIVSAGDRLPFTPPDLEPHTLWRAVDPPKGGPSQRPVRHLPGKAPWRGLAALLAARLPTAEGLSTSNALRQIADMEVVPEDYPLDVLTVGVAYGNQSAVIEHVLADALPLPVRALRSDPVLAADLESAFASAEAVMRALNDLDGNLRRASGGDPTPWDKGARPGDRFIAAVDPWARRLLAGASTAADRAAEGSESTEGGAQPSTIDQGLAAWEWVLRTQAEAIAEPLLNAVPGGAVLGHRPSPKDPHMRASTAEAYFRSALRKAIPRAYPIPTAQPQESS